MVFARVIHASLRHRPWWVVGLIEQPIDPVRLRAWISDMRAQIERIEQSKLMRRNQYEGVRLGGSRPTDGGIATATPRSNISARAERGPA
jgi:hypothetical protein